MHETARLLAAAVKSNYTYMKKALRWAYGDAWKYIGMMAAVFVFVAFLQVLIVYPIQTLATLLIGFFIVVAFTFFSEYR